MSSAGGADDAAEHGLPVAAGEFDDGDEELADADGLGGLAGEADALFGDVQHFGAAAFEGQDRAAVGGVAQAVAVAAVGGGVLGRGHRGGDAAGGGGLGRGVGGGVGRGAGQSAGRGVGLGVGHGGVGGGGAAGGLSRPGHGGTGRRTGGGR